MKSWPSFNTLAVLLLVMATLPALAYWLLISGPQTSAPEEIFVVNRQTNFETVLGQLQKQGFIRSPQAFKFFWSVSNQPLKIKDGGYRISKSQNLWQVINHLNRLPDLVWVTFYPGERKEQIGDLLAQTFNWSQNQKEKWETVDTNRSPEYFEGVYFPDTYLIPKTDSGEQIAQRLIDRFQENFQPLAAEFLAKNIRWDSALKIASLIQRETANPEEMPLIAGIIWNRLDQDRPLQIDASIQYAIGNRERGWWREVKASDLRIDSAYNTYLHSGLPPHPIANPGLDAIKAVLHPAVTDCLYYLHDRLGQIHCSTTYAQHLQNIQKFLN